MYPSGRQTFGGFENGGWNRTKKNRFWNRTPLKLTKQKRALKYFKNKKKKQESEPIFQA